MLKTNDSYCFDDQVDEKWHHDLNHPVILSFVGGND